MEAWHFWLIITVVFASFAIVLAIFIRKYKDKHRIQKLQKNLEDLELSFKHLTEEMNMVTNQNLSAMEEKCETMRELMGITDKKCLYANDLLANIDRGLTLIKDRNISGNAAPMIPPEVDSETLLEFQCKVNTDIANIKEQLAGMKNEIREELEAINRRMGYLNKRVENLENTNVAEENSDNATEKSPAVIDHDSLNKEVSTLVTNAMKGAIEVIIRREVSDMVTDEISKQLSFYDSEFAEIAEPAIREDLKNTSAASAGFLSPAEDNKKKIRSDFNNNIVDETIVSDVELLETNDLPDNVTPLFPDGSITAEIAVGIAEGEARRQKRSILEAEIMDLYNQDYTMPQIAEELKLTRTEVNLVIQKCKTMKLAGGTN